MVEVTIRAFEIADWEDIAEIFLAPNCRWGTLQMPYQSRDAIKKKLETSPPGMHRLVAVLNESRKVAGIASLKTYEGRRTHVGAVGMSVRDDSQHQGIGSRLLEAVIVLGEKWLNLKRFELEVYIDNASAINLYKKYGFAIEGTLKKYAFRDGSFVDAYVMAKVK